MERAPVETLDGLERLSFTVEEARLGIKAIAYNLLATVQVGEYNLKAMSLGAVVKSAQEANEEIEYRTMRSVAHKDLSAKLLGVVQNPAQTIELSDPEMLLLGDSLYHLRFFGLRDAISSINLQHREDSDEARSHFWHTVEETKSATRNLFKSLEPIAQERNIKFWYNWEWFESQASSTEA